METKSDSKFCGHCNTDLPLQNFSKDRNICKACIRKRQANSRKLRADSGETKICKSCQKEKPIHLFHGFKCNTCHDQAKRKRRFELISKENPTDGGRQRAISNHEHPEKCNRCDQTFDPLLFKFDSALGRFRNPCKKCYNSQAYYKSYREREKAKDLKEFLRRNAENAKRYRDEHPEIKEIYNSKRLKDVNLKIDTIRKSAASRGIEFIESDVEIFRVKVTLPCTYCEWYDENVLNGLDRIDNSCGYVDANTVTCCKVCNYIKSTHTVQSFYDRVERIYQINEDKIINKETRILPISLFGGGKPSMLAIEDRKKDYLTPDEKACLHAQPCYLCNEVPANGIDRKNSSEAYTKENSFPCCSPCNYMKKDFSLSDFLEHLHYIISTYKHDE